MRIWFLILGLVICVGMVVAFIVGIVLLVVFILRYNVKTSTAKLRAVVGDWAEDHGYQVLNISGDGPAEHPFRDRIGFCLVQRPAIVRSVEMRDHDGRIRHGWLYVQARLGGGWHGAGLTGFIPESVEVAWED
jgi:hypothetical protein